MVLVFQVLYSRKFFTLIMIEKLDNFLERTEVGVKLGFERTAECRQPSGVKNVNGSLQG